MPKASRHRLVGPRTGSRTALSEARNCARATRSRWPAAAGYVPSGHSLSRRETIRKWKEDVRAEASRTAGPPGSQAWHVNALAWATWTGYPGGTWTKSSRADGGGGRGKGQPSASAAGDDAMVTVSLDPHRSDSASAQPPRRPVSHPSSWRRSRRVPQSCTSNFSTYGCPTMSPHRSAVLERQDTDDGLVHLAHGRGVEPGQGTG